MSASNPIPSIQVVQKWNIKETKNFLQENKEQLLLQDEDIVKIENQRTDGPAFLSLKEEVLTRRPGPFELTYGPSAKIENLIKKIKGEGNSQCNYHPPFLLV